MADSSTGGYLPPTGMPAEDSDLDAIFQPTVAAITGLAGVRPGTMQKQALTSVSKNSTRYGFIFAFINRVPVFRAEHIQLSVRHDFFNFSERLVTTEGGTIAQFGYMYLFNTLKAGRLC